MNALVRLLSLPACCLSRIPGCRSIVRACSTSVGQKILMALTGLSLCGFLIAHLGGNLLLFAGEEKFNHYAETLHSYGPLLAVAETGLFGMFLLHIGLAISTTAMNKAARGTDYREKASKQGVFVMPGGAFSWMVVTGVVVAFFLVLHLTDLKFKANPLVDYPEVAAAETAESHEGHNEYAAVRAVLKNPINTVAYAVALIALGIHLSHGVRSALQTLGVNHRRWNVLLDIVSRVFGWAIAAGFLSIVVWAMAT
ncbi:MAG: succinate dehydrogenase cytochrome b subunit [Planctomycetaceae bacterium]|nr:succinate dehydrogenase cytochrome b subunit [Planctomycetaceae bacterium]